MHQGLTERAPSEILQVKFLVSDPRNKGTPKGQREGAGESPGFRFLFSFFSASPIGNSVAQQRWGGERGGSCGDRQAAKVLREGEESFCLIRGAVMGRM